MTPGTTGRATVVALTLLVSGLASAPSARAQVPTCAGRPATVVGTDGTDFIRGTPGDDVIFAGGGDDSIQALGGDDIICTGTGHDRIRAGAGDDRVLAGGGNDRVEGGDGNDLVQGGAGDDRLWGQHGHDRLLGKAGDDILRGGEGDDVVHADDGDDTSFGGAGRDVLRSGAGQDRSSGGPEADVLVGSAGSDQLGGGGGNDNIRGGGGDDVINGSDGNDQLRGGNGRDTIGGGRGADYLDGGRGIDDCTDVSARDSAICEGSPTPPGTFDCLPDGYTTSYTVGVAGQAFVAEPRPRGPAVLIGDSLTSGSPVPLADLLAGLGYGPVCVDGVGSRRLGAAPDGHPGGLGAIERLRGAHPIWSSDATWIVALGTNDSRFWPGLTAARARAEVGTALDAIGAGGRDRWWINVRTTQPEWQDAENAWNRGTASHDRLGIVDWARVATDRPELFFDDIHPNSTGQAARLTLIAETLDA